MGRTVNLPNQFSTSTLVTPEDTSNRSVLEPTQFISYTADNQGFLQLKSDETFLYNPKTQTLFAEKFSGALLGAAERADQLTTPRTILLTGDVSAQTSFNGTQDAILDVNIQPNSVTLGSDTVGDYVEDIEVNNGLVVSKSAGENKTITLGHANTSDVQTLSSQNDSTVVIQDISVTYDEFGHVTNSVVGTKDLAEEFYTKSVSDSRFVNVDGDTITGSLNVDQNLTVSGDLVVNGNTTTVNSSVTTLQDPVITLGKGTSSDDNKDRGVEFEWNDGSSNKTGFFGYDDSTGKFVFIPDGLNSSETFSGGAGEFDLSGTTVLTINSDSGSYVASGGSSVSFLGDRQIETSINGVNLTVTHTDSGVTAGTYGDVNLVPVIEIDAQGHITSAYTVDSDIRYYTKAQSDDRFVNVDGDSMSGTLELPSIDFKSPDASTIRAEMLDGGVLSFEGSNGQLFSIADNNDGAIFSVNDISGIPSIEVLDTGDVKLAEFGGTVTIADGQRVFDESFHPNADTLTTPRNIELSGDVAGNVDFDGSGDVTISTTIQPNSVALGVDTTGNYVADVNAGTGIVVEGDDTENSTKTISHANTSDISNLSSDNSNGVVLQDIAFAYDEFGHVTTSSVSTVNLDDRYYTETEADTRFVNASGDSMTGPLKIDTTGVALEITGDATLDGADASILLGNGAGGFSYHIEYKGTGSGNSNDFLIRSTNQGNGKEAIRFSQDGIVRLPQLGASVAGNTIFHEGFHPNADTLTTPRSVSISGDASGSVTFDGSEDVDINLTIANDSHTHDTRYYTKSQSDSRFVNVTGDEITGALTISGSTNPNATSMGYYDSEGTNLVLKGDSNGRSGIFFQSEKDGEDINSQTDYGFIQYHAHGHGSSSGENGDMVIGVSNDSTDNLILQAPFDTGVKIGYTNNTSGDGLTLQSVFHEGFHPNADTLTTPRSVSISGDASGSVAFDGSQDVDINLTIANDSHTHDTRYYTKSQSDDRYVNASGDTVSGNLVISGDLTVNGTTTSVNSTVTTIDDPVITLGDNSTSDVDAKDRGIEFKYGDGSEVKTGFFGMDRADSRFKFIPEGTNDSENFTGGLGEIQASKFIGDVTGTASGNYSKTEADNRFVNVSGDTINGDVTIDNGQNTTLTIRSDDNGRSQVSLIGNSQGTGRVYVGQSVSTGGGIEYNGDNNPSTTGAGPDYITLYRKFDNTDHWTARNKHSTNDWEFRGDLTVYGGDITLGGTGRIQGIDTVSAPTDATNKAYVDSAIENSQPPSTDSSVDTASADNTVYSYDATVYRTAKLLIQTSHDTLGYESMEVLVTHDGTDVHFTVYANVQTQGELITVSSDIVSGQVEVRATTTNDNTSVKVVALSLIDA